MTTASIVLIGTAGVQVGTASGPLGTSAACGCAVPGRLLLLTKKAGPELAEPIVVSVAKPVEGVVEYQQNGSGILETGKLSQTISPEPLFEDNGGNCNGSTLKNTEICDIKIKCEKEEATKGSLNVKAPAGVNITGAQRKLSCVK